ncbi:recombination protein F [bacterium BMS3Abin10]|nr:recombination protein F [bacterium BMS3Abin10]GBE40044.1 recombination protein F [bacterium BMS3Bbin08]
MSIKNYKVRIKEINIENFKCFQGTFNLILNEGLNILVGDNEVGKSTILEAMHLALTGIFNGKYLRNELTQYLFNNKVVEAYIKSLEEKGATIPMPPHIVIEIFIGGDEDMALLEGDQNSKKTRASGISLKIAFNEKYKPEYESLIKSGGIKTIPIEYYDIIWTSFARDTITAKSIPLKSALIDSSSYRYRSGSDVYISQIIRDFLDIEDIVAISQAHRKLKESFMGDPSIGIINTKIKNATNISDKEVKVSVDLSSKNAWENSLMTYLDDVPFHYIGKGEQTIVKTKLSLSHKKSKEANILLLEEPENHLSHSKLNQLIGELKHGNQEKQVVVSTHSSFVANKLGLGSIILLHDQKTTKFDELSVETKAFFEKLSGYDTLRLLLCKKAILVEGDSDELIVQKAYMSENNKKIPIEDNVDVISVGTSFLRFLEIAKKIKKPVIVVTDNDGDVDAVRQKYAEYLGEKSATKDFIRICFDETVETGGLKIGDKPFNYNTLEPKMVKANSTEKLNSILGTDHKTIDDLHRYMKAHKTDCALRIFDADEEINFPDYILDAIK